MGLKDNLYYWNESLKNPEPEFDDYYIFDNVIVSDQDFIKIIEHLRELIITYCVFCEKKTKPPSEIFDEIYDIITRIRNVQYNEFNAFWNTLDMTYSVFEKLPSDKKKEIVKVILEKYCERRLKLYNKLGYSNVTVQALYDSGSSRKKGSVGITKLVSICEKYFDNLNHSVTIDHFNNHNICYILPDRGDSVLFKRILEENNLRFEYGKGMQNKIPDLLIKYFDQIFVIEAKHLKEGGGEQNKSVGELIEFVRQREDLSNVHYIAFMDGVYFNLFISPSQNKVKKENKIDQQRNDIMKALLKNKSNFVLNTMGFNLLLEDLQAEE